MKLDQIIHKLNTLQADADLDMESVPYQSRTGFAIRKQQAQDQIVELVKTYKTDVMSTVMPMVVMGPQAAKFATISVNIAGAYIVSANELYNNLVERCRPGVPAQLWTPTAQGRMLEALNEIAHKNNIASYSYPTYRDSGQLSTDQDIAAHIKSMIRSTNGDDFNRIFLQNKIADLALLNKHTGSVLPVIFLDITDTKELEALTSGFMTSAYVTETTDQEVTEETVKQTLVEIRNTLKPADKKTRTPRNR